jgi:hypothetical protein
MKAKLLTNIVAPWRLCAVALTVFAGAAARGQEYGSLPVTYAPGGNSGTPLTNAVPANSTNAVMSDPIGCTNWLTFGASSDGVVFTPTNTPFLTLVVVIPPTSTNGVLVTNLPSALLGSIGYLQLQTMGCQGTNTTTNHSVLIWRKPKHNG